MATSPLPLKTAPSRWPRGSEWRRWDLHVHTPESRLGSPFAGLLWADSGDIFGVREAVCLLLEGGEEAFRARENRYSLIQG